MTHIDAKFVDAQALLDAIKTYYPAQFENLKLADASCLGSGIDAYTFRVGNNIFKFTQNAAHAKVSLQLAKLHSQGKHFKHIVTTYNVALLPALDLWYIQEEPLMQIEPACHKVLQKYFHEGESLSDAVDIQVIGIIVDLLDLKVTNWQKDCVTLHNILQDPKSLQLKVCDFGYTTADFPQDYPLWA